MSNIIIFVQKLYKEIMKDDLISIANDLTYKLLLALFPLIMFVMSVVSYFEIDAGFFLASLSRGLPHDVMEVISPFVIELTQVKRPSILSFSIALMIYSASSGFNTVIKGINKTYGQRDSRNFFYRRLLSIVLVLVFTIAIVFSLIMLIYNDNIYKIVAVYMGELYILERAFSFIGYLITIGILLFCVMAINKLALDRRLKLLDIMPGSCFTVVCWVVLSKAFNIYVNNFSGYSTLYGSVASIMLLMIWLNLMSIALLTGSEINAMIKVDS